MFSHLFLSILPFPSFIHHYLELFKKKLTLVCFTMSVYDFHIGGEFFVFHVQPCVGQDLCLCLRWNIEIRTYLWIKVGDSTIDHTIRIQLSASYLHSVHKFLMDSPKLKQNNDFPRSTWVSLWLLFKQSLVHYYYFFFHHTKPPLFTGHINTKLSVLPHKQTPFLSSVDSINVNKLDQIREAWCKPTLVLLFL